MANVLGARLLAFSFFQLACPDGQGLKMKLLTFAQPWLHYQFNHKDFAVNWFYCADRC